MTRKNDRGQATTELALMMSVIMAFFFWACQTLVIMFAYQQTAYASYMSARALLTSHSGSTCDPSSCPNKVQQAILTGSLFTGQGDAGGTGGGFQAAALKSQSGEPRGDQTDKGNFQGSPTGVTISLGAINSMPYMESLFGNFTSTVPTHLGASVWDSTNYTDPVRNQDGGQACTLTDNNTKDTNC